MAKAKIKRKARKVKLELNEYEAALLIYMLDHVGGSPDKSPRKHADAIRYAITDTATEMDIKFHTVDFYRLGNTTGSYTGFHFKNYEDCEL